jgi:hypothetical protein
VSIFRSRTSESNEPAGGPGRPESGSPPVAERPAPRPTPAERAGYARQPGAPLEEPEAGVTRRRGLRERSTRRRHNAGAAAVGALGSGVVAVARLVLMVAVLIALLIGLAIVLRDVDANGRNTIVKGLHEGANFFAGAFTGLVTFKGHAKREITVDWGIALLGYLIVGALIARSISRLGRSGLRFERSHRPIG